MLDYQADLLHLDGLSLSDLADRFGTPLYVYGQASMLAAARQVDAALAGATPHLACYAVKANPSLAVIQTFARAGFGADVTSSGELFRALRAGIPAERIVFSGVGKTPGEMHQALLAGVHALHVESEGEIELLNAVAAVLGRVASIALRVNPDVDPHTHPNIATGLGENKFGLPWADIPRIAESLRDRPALRLAGLSMHIGSQITRLDVFQQAARRLADMTRTLMAGGLALDYLDFGGGVGVRYAEEMPPSLAGWAATLREALGDLPLALLVEPGRALVAEAGVLLARVLGVKQTPSKIFVIVDAAMNDLIRPMLYNAYQPIWPVARRASQEAKIVEIVGPICETTDTFARNRVLALPHPGDLLAVLQVGAYGMSMASNYNSRPRPAEVLVDSEGSAHLIRARETHDDLIRGEALLP